MLQLDGREAVAAGYRKTWDYIVGVAEGYLSGGLSGRHLATELRHADRSRSNGLVYSRRRVRGTPV